jgi:hypothetical protein
VEIMGKKIWFFVVVLIAIIVAVLLSLYFYPKKYIYELEESGISYKSDYNIPEIISSYKDLNYWTLYFDLSDLELRGNEYGCGLLYTQVLSANKYNSLVLAKDKKDGIYYCIGYDSKQNTQVTYSWNKCQEILANSEFLILYSSEASENELILDKNKIQMFATKEDGYSVCRTFLNIYFDTEAIGGAISTKIQEINATNVTDYMKIQNK